MRIKAIIFDFGGTLAEGGLQTEPFEAAILEYLHSLGYQVSFRELRQSQRAALSHLERMRVSHREMSFEEVYAEVLTRLGIPVEEKTLNHLYNLYRRNFPEVLFPGVDCLLRSLSESYKLAVLSNTMNDMPRRTLAELGLAGLFKAVVCSRDLGIRKPDERAFRHVLDQIGVTSSEVVFVGDTLEEDIAGARRVGMTTIWVKDEEEEIEPECEYPPHYIVKTVLELPLILRKIEDVSP